MFDPDELTEDAPPFSTDAEPPTPTPTVDEDDESFDPDLEVSAEIVAAMLESEPTEAPPTEAPNVDGPAVTALENEVLRAVDQLGDRLDQRLSGLQAQFERELRAEASRERVVDRLHAELQEYKQDLLFKVQRPIFVDLIQLHDDVGKMAEAQGGDGEAVRDTLGSIQIALEDVLYRQGVEPFWSEGELFDPRRQRAVTTLPTDDPALAKTVAQRLRPGFQAGEKIVRPEIVTVYVHKAGPRSGED
jgi:molecular chaperone GrpE